VIIYFSSGGRLGNQIFQLAFLLSVARRGETCLLSRMNGALALFQHDLSVMDIPEGIIYKIFDKVLIPFLLRPLAWLRILGSFKEEQGRIRQRRGLLPRVRIIFGYFQSESFIAPEVFARMQLKPAVLEKAREFMNGLATGTQPVFVHVRRTDYLTYLVFDKMDPTLPLSYYNKTIRWFMHNMTAPMFIFVGDDLDYVQKNFQWVREKVISHNDPVTDLAVMTCCRGAILSNSTLAWWGAKLIEKPVKVFAPKFWLGWKSSRWYPEGIQPAFADCIEIR
jgi:hypothetical protein